MRVLGKTKKRIDKDIVEELSADLVALTVGLVGGFFLVQITGDISLIPGILVLLPGYLEMHGNLLGSLAGRLSVALHTRKIPRRFAWNRMMHDNVAATFFLGVVVALVLGIIAYILTLLVFGWARPAIIAVALAALVISLIVEIPLTIIATYVIFQRGYDPDDIMGPYVTTLGDFIGIFALLITFWVMV